MSQLQSLSQAVGDMGVCVYKLESKICQNVSTTWFCQAVLSQQQKKVFFFFFFVLLSCFSTHKWCISTDSQPRSYDQRSSAFEYKLKKRILKKKKINCYLTPPPLVCQWIKKNTCTNIIFLICLNCMTCC